MSEKLTRTTRKRRVNSINADVASKGTEVAPQSVEFDAAVASFIRHCRVKNLTERSVKYYEDSLGKLTKILESLDITRPVDVTDDTIDDCILALQDAGNLSDASINMYLRGWRAFFNYLADESYIHEPVRVQMVKAEKRVIQTFSKAQIQTLLNTPDKQSFTGYRDYVLMLTLLDTGIRISEAEGLRLSDIDWKERQLKVYGKGRKERFVPFQSTLDKHLREYVSIRGPLDHDFLFVNIDNSPMKKRTMQQNIQFIGADAGIKGVRVSPHTFRHTFAKMYIVNGGDIFSLQKILGHTSLEIVKVYVNLFSTDVARAHRMYSPLDRLYEED